MLTVGVMATCMGFNDGEADILLSVRLAIAVAEDPPENIMSELRARVCKLAACSGSGGFAWPGSNMNCCRNSL